MNYTQRTHKSRLFVALFSTKEKLLSLYNAVNGSNYKNPEDLIVNTIEDVIYLGMKNDISFLFTSTLNLYEHQSTWNPNMPLRGLFYLSSHYKGYVTENELNIYSSSRLTLPTPQYVVFYNGRKEEPEIQFLRLSDSFEKKDGEPMLECIAKVLNINLGCNQELMEKCRELYEYSRLIMEIRAASEWEKDQNKAVDCAVEKCIREGILEEFLKKHRAEVKEMILTEFNEELYSRSLKEEGREEINRLNRYLITQNRIDDLKRSAEDEEYQQMLLAELDL